ncbi:ComEC/Rec2 family competence protein [Anaerolentibacter hominis]|uniref:ComEC/Rec2 family competence protein n=1 Tax=Anaerolentibacter hominis TaxID=3079009 RepID=UPI0031B84781
MNNRKRRLLRPLFWLLCLWLVFGSAGCAPVRENNDSGKPYEDTRLTAWFIDVGQADATLFESDGHYMLVDGGEPETAEELIDYMRDAGAEKLDYLLLTHPHEDHDGAAPEVLRAFETETVILPRISGWETEFAPVLEAVDSEDMLEFAAAGESYELGEAQFTVVSPDDPDYGDDWNDWSVGIRLWCGDTSFLLYGDGTARMELDMLETGEEIQSDVLKVAHHGSSTSSSDRLLKAVQPKYAVISCGRGNSYGHPGALALERLAQAGAAVFRTDEQGTVIAYSDGAGIRWSTEPSTSGKPGTIIVDKEDESSEGDYILNANTKKFHSPSCSSVKDMNRENRKEFRGTREELIKDGYSPCGRCKP